MKKYTPKDDPLLSRTSLGHSLDRFTSIFLASQLRQTPAE